MKYKSKSLGDIIILCVALFTTSVIIDPANVPFNIGIRLVLGYINACFWLMAVPRTLNRLQSRNK